MPNLVIKRNDGVTLFGGGELVVLKDSKSYSVISFDSMVPKGEMDVRNVTEWTESVCPTQVHEEGNEVPSFHVKQVFYLIRGRKNSNVKVCLSHGHFFETIPVSTLISESVGHVLEKQLNEYGESSTSIKETLATLFSEPQTFNRARTTEGASVNMSFQISAEVKAGANLLNPNQYPQIGDNTLNFAVPCHNEAEQELHVHRMQTAFRQMNLSHLYSQMDIFPLQHHFNGIFLIFQTNLLST
ncbi:MAG: hypothetical protein OXT74_03320 [Candidatus Poribacteria bacterium]|nr:hypothetical protein [Candidatus Poribacteria bacterium]